MSKEPVNRRRFFREGIRELLRPLANAIDPVHEAVKQFEAMSGPLSSPPAAPKKVELQLWLRPPGALRDLDFRETCSRSGECVSVCPASCIKIDPTGAKGDGAPYIEIDTMPCVVCDGLYCMHACPSGALQPTPLADIDMGTAVWKEDLCVRQSGQDCTICVDQCPLGATAIELKDGRIDVKPLGCIGCGVCQYYCPTNPKSITVIPRAAKER
ncbi:MAG TPA: 4Fe-4S dicluster domain-containing protein [Tepidisphaeraceae bacterium]|jgi:ferredoxin-type protein NapG|nr:4Fe-4S dicluster domain-containing protein [Tepidisphaeraceae bacterium]